MFSINRQDCVFCKVHINFYTESTKVILIDVTLDDDGASVKHSLWSHKDCLPPELKEALDI